MGRAHEVRAASMAKTAAKKAAINGRAAKEIYMAAKRGGINLDANLELRTIIDRVKVQQVPSDVIQRALKRASGSEEINYISGRYEALGPGGSALIIDVLTTNVNRASANIREVLNKNHGNPEGKVNFLFHPAAIFKFKPQGQLIEDSNVFETLLLADIDVNNIIETDGLITIEAAFKDFDVVKTGLNKLGVSEYLVAETTMLPNDDFLELKEGAKLEFQNLIDKLDELEDVQNIYHNVI